MLTTINVFFKFYAEQAEQIDRDNFIIQFTHNGNRTDTPVTFNIS